MSRTGIGEPALAEDGPAAGGAAAAGPDGTDWRPGISVIVCAYTQERWHYLSRAIASIRGQTEAASEVILVVDHCPALLRRARRRFAGVTVVPNRFQRGLSGSRNTGLAQAQGDVVAFVDDDAVPEPTWLAALAAHYRDPRVLGVGGQVRPSWEDGRPSWFPPELDWVVGCSHRGMPAVRQPVRNFVGANMSFRREVLQELGGFATALGRVGAAPLGCEETELCLRAAQHHPEGLLLYEPAAAVRHTVPRARASWRYLRSRCYAEGLSKAKVTRLAGLGRGLSSERVYLRSEVPRAIGRSLASAATGGLAGLGPAVALLAAVAITSAGYLVGTIAPRRAPGAAPAGGVAGPASLPSGSRPGQRRAMRPAALSWAGVFLSLVLWAAGLPATSVTRLAGSGLGLLSVLPVTFWAALAVLMTSFAVCVARDATRRPLLAAHLLALVAILHATPAIVYGTLRYAWAWKHVGVTDYIAHHGINFHLGGELGVYQGWPGFFALNALLTTSAGLRSALPYASWALPVNDVLWLGPVILIARAFTRDARLIWTAAWLFELGNWVGQDYFSPQAFAYFLYLTVIAVSVRWLGPPQTAAAEDARQGRRRRVLSLYLLPVMAAIASSHQLTPMVLIAALTVLAIFRQLQPRALPLVMALVTAVWLVYGALPWLLANRSLILGGLGQPWANVSARLIGHTAVPLDSTLVDWGGGRLLSAAVGVLGAVGFWRYRRHHDAPSRRSWVRVAMLAAVAVTLVGANSYGGEIAFRAYLFALPFLAVAGAAAFFPSPDTGRHVRGRLILMLCSLPLAAAFALANYGKEAADYFSPREVAASEWLYRTAPPGALIIGATTDFPWGFVHYNRYSYLFLDAPPSLSRAVLQTPVATITSVMRAGKPPAAYLVLNRSQAADIRLNAIWPAGTLARITRDLLASGQFRIAYRNADATILTLAPPAPGHRALPPRRARAGKAVPANDQEEVHDADTRPQAPGHPALPGRSGLAGARRDRHRRARATAPVRRVRLRPDRPGRRTGQVATATGLLGAGRPGRGHEHQPGRPGRRGRRGKPRVAARPDADDAGRHLLRRRRD